MEATLATQAGCGRQAGAAQPQQGLRKRAPDVAALQHRKRAGFPRHGLPSTTAGTRHGRESRETAARAEERRWRRERRRGGSGERERGK